MTKNIYKLMFSIGILVLTLSCENNQVISELEPSDKLVNIVGTKVKSKNDMLSFESKKDLLNLVEKVKMHQPILTRQIGENVFAHIIDKSYRISEFESLYDVYLDAMENAESYYERDGGYAEFKEKYSVLYFPEQHNDYSAFLPVGDETLAKFLNPNGEILIDGKIINMKDIDSYQQLEDLGLTFSDETQYVNQCISNTRALESGGYYYISVGETIYRSDGKRKNQIQSEGYSLGSVLSDGINVRKYATYHQVFRKKGVLGIWYNYSSAGCVDVNKRLKNSTAPADGDPRFPSYTSGYSPLQIEVSYVVPINNPKATAEFSVWHKGVGYWSVIQL